MDKRRDRARATLRRASLWPLQVAGELGGRVTKESRPYSKCRVTPARVAALALRADCSSRLFAAETRLRVVEDLAKSAREGFRPAWVPGLAADEAAVVAREHHRLLTEQFGN